jgi:hypothetical protein
MDNTTAAKSKVKQAEESEVLSTQQASNPDIICAAWARC